MAAFLNPWEDNFILVQWSNLCLNFLHTSHKKVTRTQNENLANSKSTETITTESMAPLDSLPLELQVEIITNLDPIGLISLSQTSRYFRNVIDPKKREFVERLLQLELTEEFGGPAFEYRARYFDELKFLWASEPWQAIRWACCGCMQLLSHVHFDNRSLLRLELRKPSSEPSEKTLTNWRVTLQGKNWSSRDQQSISDEERSRRKRYQIADSYLPSSSFDLSDIHFNLEALREDLGFEGFDDLDEAQFRELSTEDRLEIFDRNIASIESERCGLKRHLRRCNECKYQGNQIRRGTDGRGGTPTVPIQISRKIRRTPILYRFFPNYWTGLRTGRPPIDELRLEESGKAFYIDWTLHMARCPGCERWQEVRAFRIGVGERRWRPGPGFPAGATHGETVNITEAFLDGIRCNACFAQAHGREELTAALSSWFFRLLAKHQSELELDAFWGWDKIRDLLPSLPSATQPAVQSILRAEFVASQGSTVLHPRSIEALQSLHGQFMRIWDGMPEPLASQYKAQNFRLERWCRGFKALTDYLAWLHASTKEIQENPQALVDWALSPDGNKWSQDGNYLV
ncbi:unnamed protein product [Clonostachys rosea f. rosea IK726]|uniref:Uncharacterized protein n=1 Tax=Clonostachys rosea f. rosea IK726 TaxID=1349383 RepID=A0ACA9U6S2_BIOOC|nr:unnamed protein product [Clonostachys rosea f. rosea IK726]